MPTHKQATVTSFGPAGEGGMGSRKQSNLNALFPSSPMYTGDYNEESVLNIGISALNGAGGSGDSTSGVSKGVVNDGGHTFGTFSLNYDSAPDQGDVKTGGGGLPASPYMPNPTSPGPGSIFPNDQDEFTGELPDPGVEFGSGLGGLTSPSSTAKGISSQTLGSYISGRSYEGSDGQV
mgnify:CR=1 FL=1|tara:strand:+ start:765 stop:1298 length:534 start_codon:yes stop_codon:yes gene_type:complete